MTKKPKSNISLIAFISILVIVIAISFFGLDHISKLNRRVATLEDNVYKLTELLKKSEKIISDYRNAAIAEIDTEKKKQVALIKQAKSHSIREIKQSVNIAKASLRSEADNQILQVVKRSMQKLNSETFEEIKAHSLTILDANDRPRIALSYGLSKISDNPNSSIEIFAPSGNHSIYLSSTENGVGAHIGDSLTLGSWKDGGGIVQIFDKTYKDKSPRLRLYGYKNGTELSIFDNTTMANRPKLQFYSNLETHQAGIAGFDSAGSLNLSSVSGSSNSYYSAYNRGKIRSIFGVNDDGLAFSEMFNSEGVYVYGLQSDYNNFAKTYLKKDPASNAWSTAGAYSTIKTILDLFRK